MFCFFSLSNHQDSVSISIDPFKIIISTLQQLIDDILSQKPLIESLLNHLQHLIHPLLASLLPRLPQNPFQKGLQQAQNARQCLRLFQQSVQQAK